MTYSKYDSVSFFGVSCDARRLFPSSYFGGNDGRAFSEARVRMRVRVCNHGRSSAPGNSRLFPARSRNADWTREDTGYWVTRDVRAAPRMPALRDVRALALCHH